jgi:hypothetical protein
VTDLFALEFNPLLYPVEALVEVVFLASLILEADCARFTAEFSLLCLVMELLIFKFDFLTGVLKA